MNKISWTIWKYRNRYKTSKQIIFKKSLLQQDLCDYRDAYIVVKGTNTYRSKWCCIWQELVFKNNVPFVSCISQINNTLIDNAEYLEIVIPMYIWLSTAKNIKKQQEVYGVITETN